MSANTLLAIANFNVLQHIFAGIMTLAIVAIIGVLIWLWYRRTFKSYAKEEIAIIEADYRQERDALLRDKTRITAELTQSEKEIDARAAQAKQAQEEAEQLRKDLMELGIREDEAKRYAEMTLTQLMDIKTKERKALSDDFIINAITRRMLIEGTFERRDDVAFIVPANTTMEYKESDVREYIMSKDDAALNSNARNDVYKIGGKSFIMFYRLPENKFKITLKCGIYYANRLCKLYAQIFSKATFPSGLLWYNVNNEKGCSFELIKLLVDISYNTAKAGY